MGLPLAISQSINRILGFFDFIKQRQKRLIALGGIIVSLSLWAKDKTQERLRDYKDEVTTIEILARLGDARQDAKEETDAISGQLKKLWNSLNKEKQVKLPGENKNVPTESDRYHLFVSARFKAEDNKESLKKEMKVLHSHLAMVPFWTEEYSRHEEEEKRINGLIADCSNKLGSVKTPDLESIQTILAYEDDIQSNVDHLKESMRWLLDHYKEVYATWTSVLSILFYACAAIGFTISFTVHRIVGDGELPELPK